MRRPYDIHAITWEGIALQVKWCPVWCELTGIGHLQIASEDGSALPMTETGYRSHFVHGEHVEALGGPVSYVLAWLDEAAQGPAWREARARRDQLDLFE